MHDVGVLALGIGRGPRGFAVTPEQCKTMASMAQRVIAYYTLYQKPLLTPVEILLLIQDAWRKVQSGNRFVKKDNTVDSHVSEKKSVRLRQITNLKKLKSIHSRTRGHLVAACKVRIAKRYKISGLSQSRIAKVMEHLLEGDRFICSRATREVSVWTPGVRYSMLT